jgi:hypothetical protein
MSELIDNRAHRIRTLKEVIRLLHAGRAPSEVKARLAALARGIPRSVLGALLTGLLMTCGDWVWHRFIPSHRTVFGLLHGLVLCCVIGLYLGLPRGRSARGALAGGMIGLGAAAGFYALAPLLGYAAMFPMWMAFWIAFGVLAWRQLGEPRASLRVAVTRGLVAALGSGLAFYAISGVWTEPRPGGPDYATSLASWTFAFLPGFLALLVGRANGGR